MEKRRPPIVGIVIILLILAAGGYFGYKALTKEKDTSLRASGSIETVQVTISAEAPGKVTDVLVDEGAIVKAGDVLFRLDDTLLQAQRTVASAAADSVNAAVTTANAALANAQAQYDLAFNAARADTTTARTSSWTATQPTGYDLPGWYFTQSEDIAAAQSAVDAAKAERDALQTKLANYLADPAAADFKAYEAALNDARMRFQVADAVLTRSKNAQDNADLQLAAQKAYDTAKSDLEDAQSNYDDIKDHDAAKNIIDARADLMAAEERYQVAQDRLTALQFGDQSPKLAAAKATLDQAQAAADQAKQAIPQAQANLDLIDAQIAKLTVKAPSDGVILTRSIEPGEVVTTGAAALSLGQLDSLTITVFIPEDRYGEVALGQAAEVTVDSFPGETFNATVTHIADQAEFTPKNVQTVSGRKATVFAIKLKVDDPEGRLKPGMPADVLFK